MLHFRPNYAFGPRTMGAISISSLYIIVSIPTLNFKNQVNFINNQVNFKG